MLPRSFRGEGSSGPPPPGSMFEYKPPSMLAQHKGLAVAFALLCAAFAVWCFTSPRAYRDSQPAPPPPPTQPIYIEAVPDKNPPAP